MKHRLLFLWVCLSFLSLSRAQEDNPFIAYEVPAQNLLKFNRFLINPTFSTVREDKSYINLLHRNQAVTFDDNNQSYFLSYSGRIGDRSGLGLSLYTQREGTLSNYGVLANYAYGVKLSDKSNFTFGANLSYYNSGFDESRANPVEDDPFLSGFQDSSLLTFQPGFNISYGAFDFGVYAENLIDYNLKTSEAITSFKEKTFSSHFQYTHQFENQSGIFEQGRLMPLARVRKVGEEDLVLGGSLILDLPKIGWVQGGYDSFYGASAGVGFNLNRRLSIGYTMEKGLTNTFDNFGVTHEISFAYSFTPNLTEDRVMLEEGYDERLASAEGEALETTPADKDVEIAELKRRLAENDAILAELMFRQDSLERTRESEMEKRFEMVMRMVRQETGGNLPQVEEKARQVYFLNNQKNEVADASQPQSREQQPAAADRSLPAQPGKAALAQRQAGEPKPAEAAKDVTRAPARALAASEEGPSPVKQRKFKDLEGVADGYYLVANVYKGTHYMNRFVEGLNASGIAAEHIENPDNGLKYVYLQRFDTWQEAEAAARSGLNGAYDGALWVMNVENRYTNEAYAANSEKVSKKAAGVENEVLRQNVIVRDRLAQGEKDGVEARPGGDGSKYFLIANVFSNPKNANRFVQYLNSLGLSASYFINPENNYRYVYLKRHDTWNSALISYYTGLNNSYTEKMWIMRVTPNQLT